MARSTGPPRALGSPAPSTVAAEPGTGAAADDLMDVLGRLRRSVRRVVRRDWPYRPLVESELELLRFVAAHPRCRVQDAARSLGVAPNTVSTLVRRLVARGLLERRRDARDGRAASLVLSAAAERRMSEWRDRRGRIVRRALDAVGREDRWTIEAALPALRRLVAELEDA